MREITLMPFNFQTDLEIVNDPGLEHGINGEQMPHAPLV
jgi:hypothetical protein